MCLHGRARRPRAPHVRLHWPIELLQGLQLKRHIEATLGSGNLLDAVALPPGEDLREWVAVNTVDFYNAISVLYATLGDFCTERTCEVMSAGLKVCAAQPSRAAGNRAGAQRALAAHPASLGHSPASQYEYLWADGVKIKKPVRLSAPEYIDKLFDWIEAQVGVAWLCRRVWHQSMTVRMCVMCTSREHESEASSCCRRCSVVCRLTMTTCFRSSLARPFHPTSW